jgi:type I restriction enzyme S subunit
MKPYPAYKESGIEWLGEIPSKWEMVRLRHLVNMINEKANGSSKNAFQIALENIEGFTGRLIGKGEFGGVGNQFVKGDVLFNKLRPYLCKAVIAPEDGAAVGELLVLRPTNQLNNKFLLYRLLS